MTGFSKFFTILFICTLSYNAIIFIHLSELKKEISELELALDGVRSEKTKDLTISQINSKLNWQLILQDDWETRLLALLMANGILFTSLLYKNWFFFKDKIRAKTKIQFENLPKRKQEELLNNIFCNVCLAKRNTKFKTEKMLLGSSYILVNCEECSNQIKVKNDNS